MISWVLILSMVGEHTTAITSVHGFATQQECLSAGNAWLKKMAGMHRYAGVYRVPSAAICVSQTAARGERHD